MTDLKDWDFNKHLGYYYKNINNIRYYISRAGMNGVKDNMSWKVRCLDDMKLIYHACDTLEEADSFVDYHYKNRFQKRYHRIYK